MNENRKSLKGMPKKDMKKLCENLKLIGTKYKIEPLEKVVLNEILYCTQAGCEQLNGNGEVYIQM